uniref:Uncharacterized protein n=1 Tax=Melopsittacus undulatus TaxID=13146 RepID=A0A8V5GR00_MELUD
MRNGAAYRRTWEQRPRACAEAPVLVPMATAAGSGPGLSWTVLFGFHPKNGLEERPRNRLRSRCHRHKMPPPAKYGGRHTVTLIPGDGIGPELMLHVKEVFRHACVPVDFEEVRVGAEAPEADVHNAIMAIRRNGVAIKGECGARDPPPSASGDHLTPGTIPFHREH